VSGHLIIGLCFLFSFLLNLGKFFETTLSGLCWDFRLCGCGFHIHSLIVQSDVWKNELYLGFAGWPWLLISLVTPSLVSLIILLRSIIRLDLEDESIVPNPHYINRSVSVDPYRCSGSICVDRIQEQGSLGPEDAGNNRSRSFSLFPPSSRSFSLFPSSSPNIQTFRMSAVQSEIGLGSPDTDISVDFERTILSYLITSLSIIVQFPRFLCSSFEASNLKHILRCLESGIDITPVWLVYTSTISHFIQCLSASSNIFLILLSKNKWLNLQLRRFYLRSGRS